MEHEWWASNILKESGNDSGLNRLRKTSSGQIAARPGLELSICNGSIDFTATRECFSYSMGKLLPHTLGLPEVRSGSLPHDLNVPVLYLQIPC
jgi:hypothetical protein